jgi:toxin YhaV
MESHGWRLFIHPLFQRQLEKLAGRVERLASKDPQGYVAHPATKILATINHYIREAIPRDPSSPEFRQSLRKSGSKTDPYAVFRALLESGEPPDSFAELLRRSKEMAAHRSSTR